ncbi:MAG: alkaline phosphatase family protein [Nitrospirota bacterium]
MKKAAFLGLDGTPYSLLNELMERGVLPNMKEIFSEGVFVPMDSSLPEVSSVAWSSFMTAENPGSHGIFGFTDLKPGTYSLYFPNYSHLKGATLWDRVGQAGGKSIVLNMPSTYPAKPLDGILTAGFVAPDLKKATWPNEAYEYLSAIGYKTDVDTAKARQSHELLAEDLMSTLAKRREAFLHYITKGEWDLFLSVVTETDRLHHFLWHAYEDPSHPLHGFFLDFYKAVDSFAAEFVDAVQSRFPGTPVAMMSDHGFCGLKKEVYLNYWLQKEGYLELARTPAQSWEDMEAGTKAFAMDPSRIYINLKGKYPGGSVERGRQYEGLISELSEKVLGIEVDGMKVIRKVFRKSEAYTGPFADNGPDLVVLSEHGYDLKGAISKDALSGKGFLSGMHTRDDAFFYCGRNMDLPESMRVEDAGRAVISLMEN